MPDSLDLPPGRLNAFIALPKLHEQRVQVTTTCAAPKNFPRFLSGKTTRNISRYCRSQRKTSS